MGVGGQFGRGLHYIVNSYAGGQADTPHDTSSKLWQGCCMFDMYVIWKIQWENGVRILIYEEFEGINLKFIIGLKRMNPIQHKLGLIDDWRSIDEQSK